jgi:hypothetical protein
MCLIIRLLYKFNTLEAFERAITAVEQHWGDKYVRGRVVYNKSKTYLKWDNLRTELQRAKSANPVTIHGIIAVENQ